MWGLVDVQVGDVIGAASTAPAAYHFVPPTLEAVIVPRAPEQTGALHDALVQLAEQDPLIDLRQDAIGQELYVSLYGEVQKEVLQTMLADDYGIDVDFRETTTICIERPVAAGEALELRGKGGNPFAASVGLRIEPAVPGPGTPSAPRSRPERSRPPSSPRWRRRPGRHCGRVCPAGRCRTASSR